MHDAIVREELLHQLASFEPRVTESQRIIFHNNIVYLPRHADMFRSMIEEVERLKISEDNSSSIEAQILMARSVVRKASENPELLMNRAFINPTEKINFYQQFLRRPVNFFFFSS